MHKIIFGKYLGKKENRKKKEKGETPWSQAAAQLTPRASSSPGPLARPIRQPGGPRRATPPLFPSLLADIPGPHVSAPIPFLARLRAGLGGNHRSNPVIPGIDFRAPQAPYKGLRPRSHSVASNTPRNQALAVAFFAFRISPKCAAAEPSLVCLSGRAKLLGEIALSSSSFPCLRLVVW